MTQAHRDPTCEAVERAQARGCWGCDWKARVFGAEFCCNPHLPAQRRPQGKEHMRGCLAYQRGGQAPKETACPTDPPTMR